MRVADVNTLIQLALLMVVLKSHGASSHRNMNTDRTLYVKSADVFDHQASICFLPLLKIARGKVTKVMHCFNKTVKNKFPSRKLLINYCEPLRMAPI